MTKRSKTAVAAPKFNLYSVLFVDGKTLRDVTATRLASEVPQVRDSQVKYLVHKTVFDDGTVSEPAMVPNTVATLAACRRRLREVKAKDESDRESFLRSCK